MEIKSISKNIFKTSAANKIETNNSQTNPFGVNFKGNIISADVFETENKAGMAFKGAELAAKAGNKCKMLSSAIVGSIGDMTSAINRRFDSIIDSAKNIRKEFSESFSRVNENFSKAINYLNSTNLFITMGLKRNDNIYSPKNLDKLSLSEKRNMFKELADARVSEVLA